MRRLLVRRSHRADAAGPVGLHRFAPIEYIFDGSAISRKGSDAWTRDFTMSDLTGKPAIPFRLRDSAGQSHTLEEYRGSWLLMVFHRHLG